jgi:hypothetical protein
MADGTGGIVTLRIVRLVGAGCQGYPIELVLAGPKNRRYFGNVSFFRLEGVSSSFFQPANVT